MKETGTAHKIKKYPTADLLQAILDFFGPNGERWLHQATYLWKGKEYFTRESTDENGHVRYILPAAIWMILPEDSYDWPAVEQALMDALPPIDFPNHFDEGVKASYMARLGYFNTLDTTTFEDIKAVLERAIENTKEG